MTAYGCALMKMVICCSSSSISFEDPIDGMRRLAYQKARLPSPNNSLRQFHLQLCLLLVFMTDNISLRALTESGGFAPNHELLTINQTEEVIKMTKKLMLGIFLASFFLMTNLAFAGEGASQGPAIGKMGAVPSKCDCLKKDIAPPSPGLRPDVLTDRPDLVTFCWHGWYHCYRAYGQTWCVCWRRNSL
jgi:hypothetical protein